MTDLAKGKILSAGRRYFEFLMADFAPLVGLRTRADVAFYIGTSVAQLQLLLYARHESLRYRAFTIAKRRGGKRTILAPQDDLKILQRKLAEKLGEVYRPRKVAYGFIAGRSIADNADQHLRSRYVMNVDLKDFFPSIHFGRVQGIFERFGAQPAAAIVLAQICCHNRSLPQGAPTSPIVSNMICGGMDAKLLELANKHHCKYTRYADDLTFSRKSGAFPPELGQLDEDEGRVILGQELREIIEANSFRPHPEKIWLFTRQGRQNVTGLIVNAKRNVRREWVRQLRAMINAWKKYGLELADEEYKAKYHKGQKRNGEPAAFDLVVLGKMNFLKMIKGPRDLVYRRLQQRLVEVDESYYAVMEKENSQMNQRDIFISHASEDKDDVARPLTALLIKKGLSVWFDEYDIGMGDSILQKIDEGLHVSRFGVVVLSHKFFGVKKTWTKRELDGLVAGEDVTKQKRILPIWHGITKEQLHAKSATLSGRSAAVTGKETLEQIADKIVKEVRRAEQEEAGK